MLQIDFFLLRHFVLHSFSLHFCFIQSVDTFFRPYTSCCQTAMSNPLRCLLIAEELLRSLSFHPCFRNSPPRRQGSFICRHKKTSLFEIRSGFPFRFFKKRGPFLYFYSMFLSPHSGVSPSPLLIAATAARSASSSSSPLLQISMVSPCLIPAATILKILFKLTVPCIPLFS